MTQGVPSQEQTADLGALTRRAAALWGEREAWIFDHLEQSFSFNDIEHASNRFANALIGLGVEPGERVAIMLRNQPEFPLAWLGIVKAGAVMVPINVFYKSADAGFLFEHAGVSTVVTADEFVPLLSEVVRRLPTVRMILSVDGDGAGRATPFEPLWRQASEMPPDRVTTPEALVSIQYTSGTTGAPKGCMLTHSWFLRCAWRVCIAHHGLDETDVILTAQPFSYVDPPWNVTTALLTGAKLVVLDRFHPSSFWNKLRDYRITWFYCLGIMPKLLLKQPPDPNDREHCVRYVTCSAIPPGDHAAIERRWGVPWYEAFGMTESGLDIIVSPEEHDELVGSGCIGRPMPTREARIHGPDDGPLPRGELGELVLRGPGMMDGYYREPEATAEVFRNGWLHTGDLARMAADGLIYFVGRKKDMIRRSGENIAAAEVEGVIMQHPSVQMAACVPVPDDIRGEEVKAYVVLRSDCTPDGTPPRVLVEFCESQIAYFKVPRYWAYRDDLPRTPSERIIKGEIMAEQTDLRTGAYDRVDDVWR